MIISSILFPLALGILHCFEADHVLAVAMINNNQNKKIKQLYHGFTWGIGHSVPVLIIGGLYVWFQVFFLKEIPINLELPVGIFLIAIGVFRLVHKPQKKQSKNHLKAMFLVGIMHGLAGSAAIIFMHVAVSHSIMEQFLYLLAFSIGSVLGMGGINMLLFTITTKLKHIELIKWLVPLLSIIYGFYVIYSINS